jgi:hypothetical protein
MQKKLQKCEKVQNANALMQTWNQYSHCTTLHYCNKIVSHFLIFSHCICFTLPFLLLSFSLRF